MLEKRWKTANGCHLERGNRPKRTFSLWVIEAQQTLGDRTPSFSTLADLDLVSWIHECISHHLPRIHTRLIMAELY
jgi:hypothetical protein